MHQLFPLILLQAKAGGGNATSIVMLVLAVSINSPSGEGGGFLVDKYLAEDKQKMFPLILLQAKAGGV